MPRTARHLALFAALALGFVVSPTTADAKPGMGGDRPAAIALTTSFELLALTVRPLQGVVPANESDVAGTVETISSPTPAPVVPRRPVERRAATVIEAGNGIDEDLLARYGFGLIVILGALGFAASLLDRSRRTKRTLA